MNLKDCLFWTLGRSASLGERAVILMYHSIAKRPGHFNSVAPEMFEAQMRYLKEHQYSIISLDELVSRLQSGKSLEGSIVLTFDDGYRDNYSVALPILRRYGFPATVFVVTGRIGSDVRGMEYLLPNELIEMRDEKIDIQPHTKTHPRLTDVEDSVARDEIRGSKIALQEMVGKEMDFFAYPYGAHTDRSVALVKECGFRAAVTVREGTVGKGTDLFRIPRVSIDASTTMTQFRGKLSRAVDRYEALKRIWK